MSKKIEFQWQADGNTKFYQLFQDGELAVTSIVEPYFSLLMEGMSQGEYEFTVRGVNDFGEGPMSDPITINFILPGKILGLQYSIA